MGHCHQCAGHVVDHGEATVVADQSECDEQVVEYALGLEQYDPGCGSHEERCPEGHEYEDEEQVCNARRRMRDQVGDGIAEQQADRGDAQAHDKGAPQEGQIDAAFRGLACDGSVG